MTGFGSTPTTTTQGTLATDQFPISSVAPPGQMNGDLIALKGGPVTTDGNTNKLAAAATYTYDGENETLGAKTDAAWSGSGAGSEIAILKKLVALLTAAITVSGSVTTNAGTKTSTAALALETGGNLAASKTDLDAINTAIGAISDVAYSGSGNGTEIALLKKIVAELAATLTISGSVTANAGTNLNTSSLALETGGNLASAKTDLDAINTAVGTQADAAWSGSGSGSEIAILKKIVAELAATLTVSGSGNFTVTQGTGSNLHAVLDSGSTTAVTQATGSK